MLNAFLGGNQTVMIRTTSLIAVIFLIFTTDLYAACGANTRTWQADAGSSNWDSNNNWNPRNRPNTTGENAVIVSDWFNPTYPNRNYSLGCLEIRSGSMSVGNGNRLRIVGDYFRNLNSGSLNVPNGSTWEVRMEGTGVQDFSNVDSLPRLRINNATTVNLTESFEITNRLQIINGSGIVNIDKGLIIEATAGDVLIPATASVVVKSGATFTVKRNLTVDGVLKIESGARLLMGAGRTLSIGASGLIQLDGSSGNIALVDGFDSGRYNFNVSGSINAQYFSILNTTAAGLNVTGSIQSLSDGEFHFIADNGYGFTLGASASVPSILNNLGFFDEGATGTQRNINAASYNAGSFTVNNYSGLGGSLNENDPNNQVEWGDEAEVTLQINNSSASGVPASSTPAGSNDVHLSTLSFSLTGVASTPTDITFLKVTIAGDNDAGDLSELKIFNDTNGNCLYDSGVDSQIGVAVEPLGIPATASFSIPASEVSVADTNAQCIHVLGSINSTAADGNTLGIRVASSEDVINSEGINWSVASAPPLQTGLTAISGSAKRVWHGGYGNPTTGGVFSQANQWTPNGAPTNTLDCEIGSGYSFPYFPNTTERSCKNLTLQSGGRLSWQNRTTIFSAYGALNIESNFNFDQANNSRIAMRGTSNQSIVANTPFPGGLIIANPGNIVTINSDWSVVGNLDINSGTLRITSGNSLTIGGNVNVNGGALQIDPGATLVMSNGRTLSVGASGTLTLVGSSSLNSSITSVDTSSSYTITIDGTIAANNYSLSRLGTSGLTINSGATIDATNHLQNGTFSYPVNNNSDLLVLNRQIPGNSLDQMTFSSDGSTATNTIAIKTNTAAGVLTITNYSGDRTGDTYSDDPVYDVSWASETNTLKISLNSSAPASVNQGQTYILGSVAFEQTQAGSFNDTNITDIEVTLTGSGDSSDIAGIKAYYDSSCSGSGGTLLGTSFFSGAPSKAIFSGLTGAVVEASMTTPPTRCIYFEVDVDSLATNGQTIGLLISASNSVTNSEGYAFNGSFSPPVDMGPAANIIGGTTIWTGGNSTAWNNAGNWTSGVPTASINCVINNAARDPIITTAAVCKSLTNGNGIITINAGGSLEIYGSFDNTGTFNQNSRVLRIRDNGVTATTQEIKSTSTLDSIEFNKTAGGAVQIDSGTLTVTNQLSLGTGNDFELQLLAGSNLNLAGGLNVNGASINMFSASRLRIGSGQGINVSGGTFETSAPNQAYPQNTSSMALIDSISGRYSFSATSGNVSLSGFLFDDLDNNGLNFSGAVNLLSMDGGQLRSLSTNYAGMRALQFNNSGSLPTSITNIGWNWDSYPENTDPYTIARSTGCSNRTVTFSDWFGNWVDETQTFDVNTKISNTNCNITFGGIVTPVRLTKFEAKGYDSAIVLKWKTGMEFDHKGFNVYRSLTPDSGYEQINHSLIKNSILSTSMHGEYEFHDLNVSKNGTYFYLLEDISSNDKRKWHGPENATENFENGTPEAASAGVIFASTKAPEESIPQTPLPSESERRQEKKYLTENIAILSETNNAMRIEIIIPSFTVEESEYEGFKKIVMDGYSSTSRAGEAKLPLKTLLLNIPASKSAEFEIQNLEVSEIQTARVEPVDGEVIEGNKLVSSFSYSDAYYNQDTFNPTAHIALGEILTVGEKSTLPLTILPIRFNPATSQILPAQKVIVDLFFDGATTWNETDAAASPWQLAGGLKIGVERSGIYEVSFNELLSKGIEAPFENADIEDLKLFVRNIEVPMEVLSEDEYFNENDKIRFYARGIGSIYSSFTNYLLINDVGSQDGKRLSYVDGTPDNNAYASDIGFYTTKRYEENLTAYFREPLGEDFDPIFWKGFYTPPTSVGDDFFSHQVELFDMATSDGVTVRALLKGSRAAGVSDLTHHVSLWINGVETDQSATFNSSEPYLATFNVSSGLMKPGINLIQFQAKGTYTGNKYDLIDLDYFEISYLKDWRVENNYADMNVVNLDQNVELTGFGSDSIHIFDITEFSNVKYVENPVISDLGGEYGVEFFQGDARRLIATSEFRSPSFLSINNGSNLGSSTNQADILYIGSGELLNAVTSLADYRLGQGYSYKFINLEDIFNEFGKGSENPEAIKDFITYARENWRSPKPKFVVLLGDTTYDPKGQLGPTPRNHFPTKFLKGLFYNYASDNWFVSGEDSDLPLMSVGRIPGNTPAEIANFASKVISYESGDSSPSNELKRKIELIIDKSEEGERFTQKASSLEEKLKSKIPTLEITKNSREEQKDLVVKNNIFTSLNEGRAVVQYVGHGAEDMWAGYDVFTNDDVDSLNNTVLPLVVAMNCLNSYYYFEEEEEKGLAEKLVLKESAGAIAFWGSTSFTRPAEQIKYQEAFYDFIFKEGLTIGEAISKAKVLAGSSGDPEVLNSWTLIGDPVTNLKSVKQPENIAKKPKSGGSGGGCSAIASDGDFEKSWYHGVVEYFLFFFLILIFRRAKRVLIK